MGLRIVPLIGQLVFLVLLATTAQSQHRFKGKVLNKENKSPVAYASVVTKAGRNAGCLTDTGGLYNFWYSRPVKVTDSVVVSAIGYKPIKLKLSDLFATSDVLLASTPNLLENVVVVSTLRGNENQFGYFRSWREKNNNGEIGQIIELPSKKVQIGTVQVKINKNYDTCWLKLHLRDVAMNGWPENELLKQDIIVPATINKGLLEFDLNWQNFNLPNHLLYVGFELLACSNTRSENPSFLFMGSEEGKNLFRDYRDGEWQVSEQYTIYIRMLMK